MNIVQSGSSFQVYNGEDLKTFDKLPAAVYKVDFSERKGFFLSLSSPIEIKEKIYGNIPSRIEKVLNSFAITDRNLGVILTGDKGSGKSLFAKALGVACIDKDIPLIIVDSYISGIADFIATIGQEIMVLFDEFDKVFHNYNAPSRMDDFASCQNELLPLFDGVNTSKKLFVIAYNDELLISSYLLNRPGRFHYRFTFDDVTQEEIEAYLNDHLAYAHRDIIPQVVSMKWCMPMTYDILRALAFEINQGTALNEALKDLNIKQLNEIEVSADVFSSSLGQFNSLYSCLHLDKSRDKFRVSNKYTTDKEIINMEIRFNPADLVFEKDTISLDPSKCAILLGDYDEYDEEFFGKTEIKDITRINFTKRTKPVGNLLSLIK